MTLRMQIFDDRQCRDIVHKVDSLSDVWIQRHPIMQFYTLGAATYLDNNEDYRNKKYTYNQYLSPTFDDMYSAFLNAMEDLLGECSLESDLAFPGFHILGHKPTEQNDNTSMSLSSKVLSSSVHMDNVLYPHLELLRSKYSNVIESSVISITIPVQIPSQGAGICIWNDHNSGVQDGFPAVVQSLYKDNAYGIPTVEEYKLGQAFIFPGDTLHQMAPAISPRTDDRRITLQAHGVLCDEVWRFFF